MVNKDDWRLTNQIKYLNNKVFIWINFNEYSECWKHEHCEFCSERISNNIEDINEAYCTKDKYYWVCEECFVDFKEMFNWSVE